MAYFTPMVYILSVENCIKEYCCLLWRWINLDNSYTVLFWIWILTNHVVTKFDLDDVEDLASWVFILGGFQIKSYSKILLRLMFLVIWDDVFLMLINVVLRIWQAGMSYLICYVLIISGPIINMWFWYTLFLTFGQIFIHIKFCFLLFSMV
jgi:hypothetical protein